MKSEIIKPESSLRSSTNLRAEKRSISGLDKAPHTICNLNWEQPSWSMNSDPLNETSTSQRWKNGAGAKNLKDILDQENQSIDVNKYENPTGNLATTSHKNAGESNKYMQF